MKKNTASQTISFHMIAVADGSDVTTGTPAVYYVIDGGAEGTGAGTATHEGHGAWSYVPAQAETNGSHISFTMVLADAVSQTVQVYTDVTASTVTAAVTTDAASRTASQADVSGLSTATVTNAIKAKTDNLPASPAATGAAMTLTSAYDAAKTAAQASTALSTATWTSTIAGRIDAAISTRSTLTAAQVWDHGTKTLTSFGTLVADIATAVWGAAVKVVTGGTVTTDAASREASKASTAGLALEATAQTILTDTNELQTNQANWNTATGFATPQNVTDAVDTLETAIGEIEVGGGTGTAPTVQEIDNQLTSTHGAGLWTASATGSGNIYVDHNTLDDTGDDMKFQLSNKAGITNATVTAFVKSEYDMGLRISNGNTVTIAEGAWLEPLKLYAGVQYVIEFYRADMNRVMTTVTPSL